MGSFPSAILPDKITQEEPEWSTTVIEYESGYEVRHANWNYDKISFDFEWNAVDATGLAAIKSFFYSSKGRFTRWDITDSRINAGTLTYMRFAEDKLHISKINAYFSNVRVKVRECL